MSQDWGINANVLMDQSATFHKGFHDNAERGIEMMRDVVAKHKLVFNKVVFAGHSMGAATASIMSYLYKVAHSSMDVECLVLSCPKFCDSINGKKKWVAAVPKSLHMYTAGDITPTIIVGLLSRPFVKGNEIKLCLPIAISKEEVFGFKRAFGVGEHLMYASKALHTNYYNKMHIVGSYHEYPYINYLCNAQPSETGNIVGAPLPMYVANKAKMLEEQECKAIQSQAMKVYRYFKAGAGAQLLAHTIVASVSLITNIIGYLSVPPEGFDDLLREQHGSGQRVPMFSRLELLQILDKGTTIALEQMNMHVPLETIGAIQTYILEALAVLQTGKSVRSTDTAVMITHYLNLLAHSNSEARSASRSASRSAPRSASRSAPRSSSAEVPSSAPMSASPHQAASSSGERVAKKQKRGGATTSITEK
jgi:hypothetical protein